MGEECEDCRGASVRFSRDKIQSAFSNLSETNASVDNEILEEDDTELIINDESDNEEEEEFSDEDENELDIGSIVWAPFNRRKYPAKIVGLNEVPENIQRQLTTKSDNFVICKFYGEENSFARYRKDTLVALGEESFDFKWSKFNPTGYLEAMTELSFA
jgi:hypothetical protein